MPVLLSPPVATALLPVPGVRLGVTEAAIRKLNRKDLTLIELAPGTRVAGVFTQNRFCAAPVQVCKAHLSEGSVRALVINTGVANAGTGEQGLATARASCEAVAALLGVQANQVLPFSTGVILEPLPVDKLVAGLPGAEAALRSDGWYDACHGIMTTDTVPKAASRQVSIGGKTVTLTGMSKGAGMIKPNMATMLGFLATDADVAQPLLDALVKEAADASFNSITVDGDTSTNDSFILMATGQAGNPILSDSRSADYAAFRAAVLDLSIWLAQAIVRDGEGATKFITLRIEGGRSREECRKVGYAIGHSPLVKTAVAGNDANWGRIVMAVGKAGVPDLDQSRVNVWLDGVQICREGGADPEYTEAQGAAVMQQSEITILIHLGRGEAVDTVWTCDFSYDYVKINADYRS